MIKLHHPDTENCYKRKVSLLGSRDVRTNHIGRHSPHPPEKKITKNSGRNMVKKQRCSRLRTSNVHFGQKMLTNYLPSWLSVELLSSPVSFNKRNNPPFFFFDVDGLLISRISLSDELSDEKFARLLDLERSGK